MVTSEQVKEARSKLEETQAEFASRFGVDQATIHRWEAGRLPKQGPAMIVLEQVISDLSDRVVAQ